MKHYKKLITVLTLSILTGCGVIDNAKGQIDNAKDQIDNAKDQINSAIERAKAKYGELHGDGGAPEPKPFTVVFQDDPGQKNVLISSACGANHGSNYTYYGTIVDTRSALDDAYGFVSLPGNQTPFWDIRYTNPVTKYINGGTYDYYPNHSEFTGLDARSGDGNIVIGTEFSKVDAGGGIVQRKCINNTLAGGTTVNLNDAPEQSINYGGPQSNFIYQIGKSPLSSPWKSDETGNLVLQGNIERPMYIKYGENTGGGVSFGLFLRNKNNGLIINYVIGIYAAGESWAQERRGILFDTSSGLVHVASVVSDDSWWITKSPSSQSISEVLPSKSTQATDTAPWNTFYRINIAYQNFHALLQELAQNPPKGGTGQNYGQRPEDWEVLSIMVQYELEEAGGKASLSGSFRGFEAYTSQYPI